MTIPWWLFAITMAEAFAIGVLFSICRALQEDVRQLKVNSNAFREAHLLTVDALQTLDTPQGGSDGQS